MSAASPAVPIESGDKNVTLQVLHASVDQEPTCLRAFGASGET
jgi:hypothetical protein